MKYLLFPGCCCAFRESGRAYEESLHAVMEALKFPYAHLDDWNCCGATVYMSVDEDKAFALAARNLALTEQQGAPPSEGPTQLICPCSACYLVMVKTQKQLEQYPSLRNRIDAGLQSVDLRYEGRVKIRHPLDVFVNDVGLEALAAQVTNPLVGLRVACYYGCLLVRPYAEFDDPHHPTTMDRLMRVLGAEPIDWPLKTRCCGGSLTGTIQDVGLRLNYLLLKEAKRRGADVLVTLCPFCQFNLECYQNRLSRQFDEKIELPVAFFSQLMGMAMGIPDEQLGLQRLFVPLHPVVAARRATHYVHA
ncbi:MAG: CoB--CoM heterodisulfide reductase iron-sulfur subunit B family protein [Candidatus Hydrogenedentes bacterium]|nr:CoB--CoM heterodisulfide reductase iron-sulfur subunit B family protein [Candidatus Hydrogenedentota bacterium]